MSGTVLLRASNVVKHFPLRGVRRGKRLVHAVDGVSVEVRAGETLGVVGESGCGKSTLARCLVRLTDLTGGTVEFAGRECVLDLQCGPHALKARVDRDALGGGVKPGDDVAIRIPPDRVLLFDAESGRRIG